ncbi:MAG: type II secretion system protein GspK [Planctomycetota bacterium]|nr:type II secretion system protein GspK [Planctomycetota bacterium]
MKIFSKSLSGARDACRGAALLMAFLVLIVIIAIVYQINTVTLTDERITYNEITRAQMDLAIESVLLQTYEDLAEDARAAQASEGEDPAAGAGDPGAASEPGEAPRNPDTVDSRMDRWYTPQSTSFGDIQLRIFIRDENSKYNVLNLLQPDELMAEQAAQRVARILDYARGGTSEDISGGDAEEMALAMQAYMAERLGSDQVPQPRLLTTDLENEQQSVPFTFSEFRSLPGFEDGMFEDFFGEDDERIHAITSYLTVYTSPVVGDEEEASGLPVGNGGWGVNVNTAPFAVLSGLFSGREFPISLWEGIRDYRNEAEDPLEDEEGEEGVEDVEPEPMLDEFGEEIFPKQIFDSLDELDEIYDYEALNEGEKSTISEALEVTSDVFEIVIAARISTSSDVNQRLEFESRREQEEYFRSGEHLVRVVRSVVWRRPVDDDVMIVPLVRWEVLDNAPLQVLDFPDED